MKSENRIRICRKAAKITQQELADRIGVKRAVISKYETGAISPRVEVLQNIARALGVSVDTLLGETMYIDTVENISALLNSGEATAENLTEKIKEKNPNIPEDELLRVEQYAERLRQNEEVKNIVNLVNKEKAETERIEHLLDMLKNATPEQADKIFKLIELMLGDTKN